MSRYLDFEKQFIFYGQHHANRVNIVSHVVGIPLLLWSAFTLTVKLGPLFHVNIWSSQPIPVHLPWLAVLGYISFYFLLEPVAAIFYSPVLLCTAYYSLRFSNALPNYFQWALIIHLTCWGLQLFTHRFFEKQPLNFRDNLIHVLLFSPFFVFLEILFALGYRPALQQRMQVAVGKAVYAEQKKKGVANGKHH
ncbi:DUF962-domain-containing protein [Basidiobolus meristosporus CBS 931.73]|uniref:DUF962-domain-containing protein n=1 Tax=Basidiobolus meristosporus CBS 931.73 TaxID=1314790 RepID=A0A1Y1YA70_9FUNG|nr:DUF962-domain-containing protein [Basidiobolus meristosporus CBS 931.73]|eukprot:ORX94907.1 DUF962-domain-containing protein [Basidiobolus meristosporus CBS 931.73]